MSSSLLWKLSKVMGCSVSREDATTCRLHAGGGGRASKVRVRGK